MAADDEISPEASVGLEMAAWLETYKIAGYTMELAPALQRAGVHKPSDLLKADIVSLTSGVKPLVGVKLAEATNKFREAQPKTPPPKVRRFPRRMLLQSHWL